MGRQINRVGGRRSLLSMQPCAIFSHATLPGFICGQAWGTDIAQCYPRQQGRDLDLIPVLLHGLPSGKTDQKQDNHAYPQNPNPTYSTIQKCLRIHNFLRAPWYIISMVN